MSAENPTVLLVCPKCGADDSIVSIENIEGTAACDIVLDTVTNEITVAWEGTTDYHASTTVGYGCTARGCDYQAEDETDFLDPIDFGTTTADAPD